MSTKRHYWSKMNHDEARHSIELMDDAESGRWFRGWLIGAGGATPSDDVIQSKPIEWRTGYAAGRSSFADAQEYSQKQADRVSKRYTKATTVTSGSDPVDETATEIVPILPITEQRTTNNEKPKKARQAAFDPREFDCLIPLHFQTTEFIEAWRRWVVHRKEIKSRMTESMALALLEGLKKDPGTPAISITWIQHSIASGYKGIYAPKTSGGFQKPGPKLTGFTPEYMEQGRIVRNDGLDF